VWGGGKVGLDGWEWIGSKGMGGVGRGGRRVKQSAGSVPCHFEKWRNWSMKRSTRGVGLFRSNGRNGLGGRGGKTRAVGN
jgi:hypothetical protein